MAEPKTVKRADTDAAERPRDTRPVVSGTQGVISSGHPLTSMAGMRMLLSGGNAFDALAAAVIAAAVVEPIASYSLGAESVFMLYDARSGDLKSLSGQGTAPARSTVDFYRSRGAGRYPDRTRRRRPAGLHGARRGPRHHIDAGQVRHQELCRGRVARHRVRREWIPPLPVHDRRARSGVHTEAVRPLPSRRLQNLLRQRQPTHRGLAPGAARAGEHAEGDGGSRGGVYRITHRRAKRRERRVLPRRRRTPHRRLLLQRRRRPRLRGPGRLRVPVRGAAQHHLRRLRDLLPGDVVPGRRPPPSPEHARGIRPGGDGPQHPGPTFTPSPRP